MLWHDITRELSRDMSVYPGDQPFSVETDVKSVYQISRISLSAHCGTHIDAPAHFLLEGYTQDYPLSQLCGKAILLDYSPDWLTRSAGYERVLLRGGEGLSREEGERAAENHLLLVGTDRISIAPLTCEMPTHKALLGGGVCILENADFAHLSEGEYQLICLPMKLKDVEGAPVRALLGGEA